MAFDLQKWNQISSGKNTESFSKYSYQTDEDIDEVLQADYFNPKANGIRENDVIELAALDAFTPSNVALIVDAPPAPGEAAVRKVEDYNYSILVVPQWIEPEFFNTLTKEVTSIVGVNSFLQDRSFDLESVEIVFSGTLVAPGVTLKFGINDTTTISFFIPSTTNQFTRVIIDLGAIGTVAPGDILTVTKDASPAQTGIKSFNLSWLLNTL